MRTAEEKSNATYEATKHLINVIKQQELRFTALYEVIGEMSQRQTAMEVVMNHVLELQGLKAQDIIEAYVLDEQTKAAQQEAIAKVAEGSNGESTATEGTTEELVGVLESTDQSVSN